MSNQSHSNPETPAYFDLHTTGIGYLSQIRQVTPQEGEPFLSVTLAALRGREDKVQYSYFECRVSGKQAKMVVNQLQPAVDGKQKVLIGFTLSDVHGQAFTFQKGDKAGEPGISLKGRLLHVGWAKIDGQPFYKAPAKAA